MLAILQLAIAASSTLLTASPFVSAAPSHGVDRFLHKRISTDFANAIEQAMKDASLQPIQAAGAVADATSSYQNETTTSKAACFPALDFQMPDKVPDNHDNWWCKQDDEYAFLGFSYEVTPCQSKSKMTKEFKDIRERFNGRYIRMYGACDKDDFYNDLIDAAWEAGIGVYALIWFGWENPNAWKARKAAFMDAVKSNPKTPYVVRALQVGSEPLFDSAIAPGDLASLVKKTQKELSDYGIKVTVSDMAFGYEKAGGAKEVLDAIDFASIHTLPFFSSKASTGGKAWPIVTDDIDWFHKQVGDKKVVLSQNGWPSTQYDGVRPNSDAAVANKENEEAYYKLLDKKCEYFKNSKGGGVAWFWHLYADYMEPGYGVLGGDGNPKFDFKPKTSC